MATTAEQLDHQEKDLDLRNRQGGKKTASPPSSAEEQLAVLRRRIQAGTNAVGDDPRPKDAPACRECFQRGWLAAMQSLLKE